MTNFWFPMNQKLLSSHCELSVILIFYVSEGNKWVILYFIYVFILLNGLIDKSIRMFYQLANFIITNELALT